MRDISKAVCRGMEPAVICPNGGGQRNCRGLVVRMRPQSGGWEGDLAHPLGELCRPLYVFVGDGDAPKAGDGVVQGGASYRVISAWDLQAGGRRLCFRAVLERREDDDGQ